MFYLKYPQRENSAVIAIFRFKGNRYKIPTGESTPTKFWRKSNQRCSPGRSFPDGAFINDRLRMMESDIKQALNGYKIKGITPTNERLRLKLQGELEETSEGEPLFADYIRDYAETIKEEKALSTYKKYITTLHKIEEYERARGRQLKFADINIFFYRDFKQWFYAKYDTRNYFGSIIKNIKRFMNTSTLDGIHSHSGHKHPEFKIESEEADTVYLSLEELKTIYDLEITDELIKKEHPKIYAHNLKRKKESMEKVRARFLIGAYTLLRVSDFKRLSEVNVRDGFIKIKPKKRSKGRKNRDVIIPLHPLIKEILESGIDLSESLSEQKINKHIKEICKMAEINNPEAIIRTEKGREVEKYYDKWELITTHTARRSAATNMLMSGMEASDIMLLGGWSSEKSFWKYIRMEPEVNARRLADHPFFR